MRIESIEMNIQLTFGSSNAVYAKNEIPMPVMTDMYKN